MRRLRDMIKRLKRTSAGFTLVEAMISMAVFSIGILGIAAMQTNAIRTNTVAEDVQQNTVGSMAQIEELMAADYLDQRIKADGTLCEWRDDSYFKGNDIHRIYNICVESRDNANIPGAKRIVVTSTFTPKDGRTQSVVLHIFKPNIK